MPGTPPIGIMIPVDIPEFAENLVGLGFFYSVFYIKLIPTHEKLLAVGKSGPYATF